MTPFRLTSDSLDQRKRRHDRCGPDGSPSSPDQRNPFLNAIAWGTSFDHTRRGSTDVYRECRDGETTEEAKRPPLTE